MRLLLLSLCLILLSFSQQNPTSDATEILERITALEKHSENPRRLLDPELGETERDTQLKYLADEHYELSIAPISNPQLTGSEHAVVNARIHFKDSHVESNLTTEIAFVKRGSHWYFANYDFLGWPIGFVIYITLGSVVAISWAAMVLVLRMRLRKAGQLNAKTSALTFIPFSWPHLWRMSRS